MNFKDTNPIYLQIAERICDEILQGTYREDDRIPSVREYAAMVEVNANTVVRTFDHLQSLEIIYNKRGLGYFVAKGAVRRIAKERKRDPGDQGLKGRKIGHDGVHADPAEQRHQRLKKREDPCDQRHSANAHSRLAQSVCKRDGKSVHRKRDTESQCV